MSGVALRVFQQPRLLPFQRALQQERRRCNLRTLFGVQAVPADTQRRAMLDGGEVAALRSLVPQLGEKVRRAGWGGRFTTILPSGLHQGRYSTVGLDGSEYFRSTTVQCPPCLRQPAAKGRGHSSRLDEQSQQCCP